MIAMKQRYTPSEHGQWEEAHDAGPARVEWVSDADPVDAGWSRCYYGPDVPRRHQMVEFTGGRYCIKCGESASESNSEVCEALEHLIEAAQATIREATRALDVVRKIPVAEYDEDADEVVADLLDIADDITAAETSVRGITEELELWW